MGVLADYLKEQRDRQNAKDDDMANFYTNALQTGNLNETQRAEAWAQVEKLHGRTKEAKGPIQQIKQIVEGLHNHFAGQGAQAPQGQTPSAMPQPPQAQSQAPVSPMTPVRTPQPTPTTPGVAGAASGGAPPNKMPAPPPTGGDIAGAAYPNQMDQYKQKSAIDEQAKIAEEKAKPGTLKTMERHVTGSQLPPGTMTLDGETPDPQKSYDLIQTGNPEAPYAAGPSGATAAELTPKWFNYTGADGQPHRGFTVGGIGNAAVYDSSGKKLDMDPDVFSAWMQSRTTTTDTMKEVPQPDGSIKLVPVQTTSTQTRGNPSTKLPTPPKSGAAASKPSSTSTPTAASAKPKGAGGARVLGSGTTVGGKVPAPVAKAFDLYNAAQERFNVMTKALKPAMGGDQQAMINLLANHLGMTAGLQKGARISQAMWTEAMQSTPWLDSVLARFTKVDPKTGDRELISPLRGVVLTNSQMKSMVELAKVRLGEDKAAFERERSAAQQGYGMYGNTPTSMPPPPASGGSDSGDPVDSLIHKHAGGG